MDLLNLCRLCLRIPKQPINLFESKLLEKIEIISSIRIKYAEELSGKICEECLRLINISYNFRLLIINSIDDLNSRLETLKETNYLTKSRKASTTKYESSYNVTQNSIKQELNGKKADDKTNKRIKLTESTTNEENSLCTSDQTNPKVYNCHLCSKICYTSKALRSHRHYRHNVGMPRYIVCNICGMELLDCNVKKHITAKHSNEPSYCDECGKLCAHAEALKTHKKEHHSIKKFTCQVCGKTFSLMCRLRAHLKSHNKEIKRRKQCCTICGKLVQSLRRHMLSHTGERPHICSFCNKGLTSSGALKVHIRLHTNERPYVCTHCGAAFPQTVSLRTHLRNKHGITQN